MHLLTSYIHGFKYIPESRDDAVVKVHASHRCVPGSFPDLLACVAVFSVSFQASESRAKARRQREQKKSKLFALAPCLRATSPRLLLSAAKRKRNRLLRRLRTWRHMWVDPCSGFFPGISGFPPSTKTNMPNSNLTSNQWTKNNSMDMPLLNIFIFI